MQKTLKAELDEALMHVGELAEGLELAESELDMLRPLEDNRARGLVSNELQWISGQLGCLSLKRAASRSECALREDLDRPRMHGPWCVRTCEPRGGRYRFTSRFICPEAFHSLLLQLSVKYPTALVENRTQPKEPDDAFYLYQCIRPMM